MQVWMEFYLVDGWGDPSGRESGENVRLGVVREADGTCFVAVLHVFHRGPGDLEVGVGACPVGRVEQVAAIKSEFTCHIADMGRVRE